DQNAAFHPVLQNIEADESRWSFMPYPYLSLEYMVLDSAYLPLQAVLLTRNLFRSSYVFYNQHRVTCFWINTGRVHMPSHQKTWGSGIVRTHTICRLAGAPSTAVQGNRNVNLGA